ncbi:LysR substrate-binding domain-containing protein [Caulobacter sp. UNC279MFTsu5.1]|uniref:LysR substrate-binding domain-containing protein n=1 Tax=Caulobacter sp. UNC279MFTsu5.1 TaxID=1502775 RepID=UPI00039BDDDE|nr:LysR substrate-binding domain-containing protein [Caulobacter sp. UNC279MFTsu5.1]SFJ72651.1 LysR family transcriptional regulator, glycine cleavage system transcriptional activator [Caulobacter sp. UNC279MFTsu5.1]
MKRPSLESLRVLSECVRSGSFAAAAKTLFLTPAAVSLRIRTLEQDLGKPLFVRRGPRVTATQDAIALAGRVDRALGDIDQALEAFHRACPVIRVTAPPTFAARWLAPRVDRYQADHPGVAIELDVSTDLRPGRDFDIAVRTGSGPWPDWTSHPLFPVDLTPMLDPDQAARRRIVQPTDLEGLILLPHPDWPRWLREAGAPDDARFRFAAVDYPSHELNAASALAGQGVALLPRSLFQPMLDDGRLVAPFAHTLVDADWHFALLHEAETRPEPAGFVAWLLSQAPQSPKSR